jgi:arylsulfatase A-like enzyme
MAALQRTGVAENTLVIFTTDNGPWLSYGNHAGSAGKLRGGKGTVFEGGVRVPCVMRLPGKIPAGSVCHEPAMTIDILPTIAALVSAELPPERKIDGRNIWPLLTGEPGARNPHEVLYFYWINELHALRSGPWKLHLPHRYTHLVRGGADGKPGKLVDESIELSLYNVDNDPSETHNVVKDHAEVVERMLKYADQARADLGDKLTGTVGNGLREPGRVE